MADEEGMIRDARTAGFSRCFRAHTMIVGIGPPPPPGRVDPLQSLRRDARRAAASIFNQANPNMESIGRVVGEMKNWLLPNTKIVKADPKDPRCGFRAAFSVGNRPPIQLCPFFFDSGDEQRTRTMIHEAAHLTGIGDPDGELYYLRFNCLNENPQIQHGRPTDRTRIAQADSWAKYVHCVTGQRGDKEDIVTPRPATQSPGATPSGRIHTVQAGDYLVKIAQLYYGDGTLWRRIHDANRTTIGPNPDKIYPGQRLIIP